MAKQSKRIAALLMMIALIVSGLPSAIAAEPTKLVYHVKYASEDLSTPTDWYNSSYFNNPEYKENRFVQYWWETPITPGGPRDTGFYMVYNEEGLNLFFQSNEAEREANGVLKNSSIEMFLQTGLDDVPYHQMIIPTNGGPIEYYEWQTEYRNNRPLKGNVTIINEEIPTGWGTTVHIPWETYYEYVPLNGEDWAFAMIRWSPSNSPTWGGHVHQVGRFNVLDFQTPSAEQRTEIQKHIIRKAWEKFNDTAASLRATWLNGNPDNAKFFNSRIQPLIAQEEANGSQVSNLDSLSAAEIDALYRNVERWFEFRYEAEDSRMNYVLNSLFSDNATPTVTDVTYVALRNTVAGGVIFGEDPDGDVLTYALGTAPANGTATVDAAGGWTYTPNPDFTGDDRFTVTVSDAAGASATAAVNLLVIREPETFVMPDPAEPNGSNGWYTSDVTVTLTTTGDERIGGADRTEYRLNGGEWNVYDGQFEITEEGDTLLEYRGVDMIGNVEAVKTATIRIDKTAPAIEIVLDKTILETPNHNLADIQATVTTSDGISGVDSFALTSITHNESDNGTGDGNTVNDIQNAEFGTADTTFSLRAERSGKGDGRIYTITYTVTDQAGLTGTGTATVTVPH
ncbi:Ig-like domain-containing protein [Paenibacillus thermotolerans]|uniref:Ig-like domain-containing protein n=1 Tax=Paenibacillus thermotolerans TaxID=3027807 RepID=UPI002368523E|nr:MULTISPECIES: Ig-like domain-containing protein [unclassified Paenibacillus]